MQITQFGGGHLAVRCDDADKSKLRAASARNGYRYVRMAGIIGSAELKDSWIEGSHDMKTWIRLDDQPEVDEPVTVEVPR